MQKALAEAQKLKDWIPSNTPIVLYLEAEIVKHFARCTGEAINLPSLHQIAFCQFLQRILQ